MAANPSNPLPHSPTCPFCTIASTYPPFPPSVLRVEEENATAVVGNISDRPQTHLILSTRHVLAFLDIMPLTRGHVLVISRRHYERLGDVGVVVGKEVGFSYLHFLVCYSVVSPNRQSRMADHHTFDSSENGSPYSPELSLKPYWARMPIRESKIQDIGTWSRTMVRMFVSLLYGRNAVHSI